MSARQATTRFRQTSRQVQTSRPLCGQIRSSQTILLKEQGILTPLARTLHTISTARLMLYLMQATLPKTDFSASISTLKRSLQAQEQTASLMQSATMTSDLRQATRRLSEPLPALQMTSTRLSAVTSQWIRSTIHTKSTATDSSFSEQTERSLRSRISARHSSAGLTHSLSRLQRQVSLSSL